jgi:outer membrane protein
VASWALCYPNTFALGLKEAFERAQVSSDTKVVQIEEARLRQAMLAVSQAQASLLPQVSANAAYSRADYDDNRADQTTARMTLSQNLYRGGRDDAGVQIAEASLAAQKLRVETARLGLFQQVSESYFAVHSTNSELNGLNELLTVVQKRMRDIRERIRIGRSRLADQLTAETQIALLHSQIEKAREDAAAARRLLSSLTGIPAEAIQLDTAAPALPVPAQLSDYLAAVERRPDLEALQQEIRSARESIELAKGEHFPSVDLAANYYVTRPQPNRDVKWDVGLAVSVPIYAGGSTSAKVRSQAERVLERQLLLESSRLAIRNEVTQSHARVTSLQAQIRALDEVIRISDRNFQEQNRDYQLGLQSSLEVLQALNTLQENRRARDKAFYQYLSSYHRLEALAGRLP